MDYPRLPFRLTFAHRLIYSHWKIVKGGLGSRLKMISINVVVNGKNKVAVPACF